MRHRWQVSYITTAISTIYYFTVTYLEIIYWLVTSYYRICSTDSMNGLMNSIWSVHNCDCHLQCRIITTDSFSKVVIAKYYRLPTFFNDLSACSYLCYLIKFNCSDWLDSLILVDRICFDESPGNHITFWTLNNQSITVHYGLECMQLLAALNNHYIGYHVGIYNSRLRYPIVQCAMIWYAIE